MKESKQLIPFIIFSIILSLFSIIYTHKLNKETQTSIENLALMDDIQNNVTGEFLKASPDNGSFKPGDTYVIELTNNSYEFDIKAVTVGVEVENASIINYTPPSNSNLINIGTCDEYGAKYTETRLCVDIAAVGDNRIQEGASLGSIEIKFGEDGQAILTTSKESGYLIDGETTIVSDANRSLAKFLITE